MKLKARAIVDAIIALAVFTVLPLNLHLILPPEMLDAVSAALELSAFLNQVAAIGVAMAGLALVKGLVDRSSIAYLAVSTASKVVWLLVTFIVLGLGDLGSLGVTTFSMEMENGVSTAALDLSLFAYLAISTVLLKILQSILEFREARSEAGGDV